MHAIEAVKALSTNTAGMSLDEVSYMDVSLESLFRTNNSVLTRGFSEGTVSFGTAHLPLTNATN